MESLEVFRSHKMAVKRAEVIRGRGLTAEVVDAENGYAVRWWDSAREQEAKMMSEHTPGPWKVEHDDTPWTEGAAEIAQEYGEPFGDTCIMFSVVGGPEGDTNVVARCPWEPMERPHRLEELRANARLIAAAPEMLDALRDAESLINGPIADLLTGDSMGDMGAYDVLTLIRDAIAKAEGRTT